MYPELLELRVDGIKWESPDTATFYLVEKLLRPVPYRAGQFLTFIFGHHHEEIRRSYSLSSSPDDDRLAITVKRISNGEISRFMLSKVKVGDILSAVKPAGVFTVGNFEAEKDIIYFAAGSGITPVLSHIKYILNRKGSSKLHLLYSNQNRASVLFHNELNELVAKYPDRLNITHLLSSDANRLNNYKVELLVKQQLQFSAMDAEFYICGPFAYMRTISLTLMYMGIEASQIHKENFVLETVPVSNPHKTYPPQTIRINYRGETYDIAAGENQSILQAALQNSIPLPYRFSR